SASGAVTEAGWAGMRDGLAPSRLLRTRTMLTMRLIGAPPCRVTVQATPMMSVNGTRATDEFLTFLSGAVLGDGRYTAEHRAHPARRGREETREGPSRRPGGAALRRYDRIDGRGRLLPRESSIVRSGGPRPDAASSRRHRGLDHPAQARAPDPGTDPHRQGHHRGPRARPRQRRRRLPRQAVRVRGAS